MPLPPLSAFEYDGKSSVQTSMSEQYEFSKSTEPNHSIAADLKENMDHYLGSLKESKVKSLQELVDWNSAHEEEALTIGMTSLEPPCFFS